MDVRQECTGAGACTNYDDYKRACEKKGTAENKGAQKSKYDVVPGDHGGLSLSLLGFNGSPEHGTARVLMQSGLSVIREMPLHLLICLGNNLLAGTYMCWDFTYFSREIKEK
jgi:hypothetical protein